MMNDIQDSVAEQWKSLLSEGFPSYHVSTLGRIVNSKTKRFLSGYIKKDGYVRVTLSENGKSKVFLLHRLIAIVFLPVYNGNEVVTVDHINRKRDCNTVSNLRWATRHEQSENQNKTAKISRPVNQYDINGTFLARWDDVNKLESLNISTKSAIYNVCRGTKKTAGSFVWTFADTDDIKNEIWYPIPYEGFGDIRASNKGRIKKPNGKIFYGYLHNGYWTITLTNINTKEKKTIRVHRLIIGSIQGRQDTMQVNHIDGICSNNKIENLEYVTQQQNVVHAIKTGLKDISKVKTRAVLSISDSGEEIHYKSIKDASDFMKVDSSAISRACTKNGKSKGLRWRYTETIPII